MICINTCSFNLFIASFMDELPFVLLAKPIPLMGRSPAIPVITSVRFTGSLKTLLLALSPLFIRQLSPLLLLKKPMCFIGSSSLFSPQKKLFFKKGVLPSQILARVWAKTS